MKKLVLILGLWMMLASVGVSWAGSFDGNDDSDRMQRDMDRFQQQQYREDARRERQEQERFRFEQRMRDAERDFQDSKRRLRERPPRCIGIKTKP